MRSMVAAELLKLRTVRSTWGYVLVVLLLAGVVTSGNVGSEPEDTRLEPDFQARVVLDASFPAAMLALLLGIILLTNEFRHGTITRTLLVSPRRVRLLAAKLLTGAGVGLGLFLVALVVTTAVAVIWLSLLDVPLEPGEAARSAGRGLVAAVAAGALGVAFGAVVHSQVGALVGALLWIFVAEPLTSVLLGLVDSEGVGEYLPASSVFGIVDSSADGLSFPRSALVALAWIGLMSVLAALRTGRRDIT